MIVDQEREPFDRAARTEPDAYRAHVDTDFEIDGGDATIPLRLVRVSDDLIVNGFLQFSLFFHGSASRLLPQGTYVLRHASLGSLALFIVPILGSNHERIIYEACFNRRVSAIVPSDSGGEP